MDNDKSESFRLQLPAHGQISGPREKIPGVIDLTFLGSRRIVGVDGRNPKQFACAFAVASGDDRGVHIDKTALLKKLVNGESEPAPDPEDRTEKVGARTKMGNLTEELRSMPFLLEGITLVRSSDNLDLVGHDFPGLALALGSNQLSS